MDEDNKYNSMNEIYIDICLDNAQEQKTFTSANVYTQNEDKISKSKK